MQAYAFEPAARVRSVRAFGSARGGRRLCRRGSGMEEADSRPSTLSRAVWFPALFFLVAR